jgi:putative endonuclease
VVQYIMQLPVNNSYVIAARFFRRNVPETGFRCHHGEIDIIAQKTDYPVFVEVRTKSNPDFGTPEESITQAKKDRLIASALTYTSTHQDLPPLWRIDVVAIEVDDKGKTRRIQHIENAIERVSRFNCQPLYIRPKFIFRRSSMRTI